MPTEHLGAGSEDVSRAADLLRQGGLVAFPTETVYGLGADAGDGQAVARVFAAKGRPSFNPLIVHLAQAAQAADLATFDADAQRLADAFWPGPLTLVLPVRDGAGLSDLVTAGLATVGLRVPAHPLAARLLAAAGVPVAAPSANLSGRISPTTADHVLDELAGVIDAVLDGGACGIGVESTIVATGACPRLLRPGGLPLEAVEACLGKRLRPAGAGIEAPGQMASHYAPRAAVRLEATSAAEDEVHLGFGPVPGDLSLSRAGDLVEAAAGLFAALRILDARGASRIAVAPIPEHGLGRAINDRLRRAAAPRGQA